MNIILGLISAYITICIILCLTYLIPHTIPQNLARSLEDAPQNRIVNVEIGDNDLSYVKLCSSGKIRHIESINPSSLIFKEYRTEPNNHESIIFFHPNSTQNTDFPLKIITENGNINLNIKIVPNKELAAIVGEPLIMEMATPTPRFFNSFVEKVKMKYDLKNEQMPCSISFFADEIDNRTKNFIKKFEPNTNPTNSLKLAELELRTKDQEFNSSYYTKYYCDFKSRKNKRYLTNISDLITAFILYPLDLRPQLIN